MDKDNGKAIMCQPKFHAYSLGDSDTLLRYSSRFQSSQLHGHATQSVVLSTAKSKKRSVLE